MNDHDFINGILLKIDDEFFEQLKNKLIGEYIRFDYLPEDVVIPKVFFAEKMSDYFKKVEIMTGKSFSKIIELYVENLDTLVGYRIEAIPSVKKNAPTPPTPRSRKYYERAKEIIESRNVTVKQLTDYVRIMMCLRQAIIDADDTEISNFEYSSEYIMIDRFISSMRTQKDPSLINIRKKMLFDTSELYSIDTCTFVIMYVLFYFIKSNEMGE